MSAPGWFGMIGCSVCRPFAFQAFLTCPDGPTRCVSRNTINLYRRSCDWPHLLVLLTLRDTTKPAATAEDCKIDREQQSEKLCNWSKQESCDVDRGATVRRSRRQRLESTLRMGVSQAEAQT
eukprot:COSAG02_NODE_658_length_18775_cov_3.825712_3_plen_122_part_00